MNSNITKLKDFQKFNTIPFHIDILSPTETIDLHYHDCVEMIFVKNGRSINRVDPSPFNYRRGHLFLASGQVSHTMFSFENFSAYRLLFDMSIFDEFPDEQKSTNGFLSLFVMSNISAFSTHHYHSIMTLNEEYTRRLIPLFEELLCAYEDGGVLSESYIKSLFYSIVLLILKRFHERSKVRTYAYTHLFNMLIENINEPTVISKFADEANISRSYLYKIFSKRFGKSPKQFIKDVRVRNAKTLLALTDKSITEVASECGFENPVYFAEIFKSVEGVSPRQYRNKYKKR